MTTETLLPFLGWCGVINIGLLLYWALMAMVLPDFFYKVQTIFMKIPRERFDKIHYKGMLYYKILIFMFNIVPYLSLRIIL